ncbi:MAG: OmpH family outer membrane protein [Verrucomicrobiota bacterium]
MRLLLPVTCHLVLGCALSLLAADAPRIAVVDLEKVFESHPTTADATRTLTTAREASRDEFKEKSNSLKEILQEHQELIRAGRKDEAAEKLKEANQAEKRIATLRTTVLRDLEEEFRRSKQQIITEIGEAIAKFNEDERYALILDRSSKSSNGLPQVLDAPGAEDITEKVIEFVKNLELEGQSAP